MTHAQVGPKVSQWHKAILDLRGVSGRDKSVLWTLFGHADWKSGTCYPSIATLAEESGFKRRTVQRGIGKLVSLGILTCESRKGGSPGQATRYSLMFDAIVARCVTGAPVRGASGAREGRHTCAGGASETTPTGVTVAPKLSYEQKREREGERPAPPGGFDLEAMKNAAAEGVAP